MRRGGALLGALAAVLWILAGITGAIRWTAGDGGLMAREMLATAPPERTGLPAEEYPAMGALTADYLTGKTERFQRMLTGADGTEVPAFHDYEEAHMADVRGLIRLDITVFRICLTGAAALSAAGLLRAERRAFCRGIRAGLLSAAAAAAVFAVWALADFDGLFVTFHRVAFTNDGWLLDPRTDLLIRLMPESFFIRLGVRGALRAMIAPMLLAGFAAAGLLYSRKKRDGE